MQKKYKVICKNSTRKVGNPFILVEFLQMMNMKHFNMVYNVVSWKNYSKREQNQEFIDS